jgi:hypothetical protein
MIRKIIHIFFALLILVSTTGFTINMHYCHGQLVDLALFAPAKSCCDRAGDTPCQGDNQIGRTSHCQNESITVEQAGDFEGSSFSVNLENTYSIDLLLAFSTELNLGDAVDDIRIKPPWHKEPPPYREVILSRIQTYLI